MTKIVRALLGLPTLRAGPQFQNPKPVLVIYYWNLRFVCNLVLGVWDFIDSITPGRGYLDKTDNLVAASVKETDRT